MKYEYTDTMNEEISKSQYLHNWLLIDKRQKHRKSINASKKNKEKTLIDPKNENKSI